VAETVDSNCHHQVESFENRTVDHHHANREITQRAGHYSLQLLPAGFNKVLAYRALLQPVGFAKLLHDLLVPSRRQSVHNLVPNVFFQQRGPLEQLVAAQRDLAIVHLAAYSRPCDRNLLPINHAVALLAPPAIGLPIRGWLGSLSHDLSRFRFEHFLDEHLAQLPEQFP